MTKSRKKYITIILGLVVLAGGLVFGVISPAKQSIKSSGSEVMNEYEHLQDLLNVGQGIEKMKTNYQLIKSDQGVLDGVFLYSGKELGFITDLEGLADKHKIDQTISFLTDKMVEQDGMKIIPLSLHVNGGFNDFISYLNDLEALNYYVSFESLEIRKETNIGRTSTPGRQVEGDTKEGEIIEADTNLNVTLSGFTYWQ